MKHFIVISLLAFLLFSACQPANPDAPGSGQIPTPTSKLETGGVKDTQGFREALAVAGASIGSEGQIEQPFFSVPGQIVTVNGEAVQVFEYADSAQAEQESSQVSPDGSSIGTTMATWIGPPHFFRAERLIVLYVGEDQTIIELIESVLGPQFAGA